MYFCRVQFLFKAFFSNFIISFQFSFFSLFFLVWIFFFVFSTRKNRASIRQFRFCTASKFSGLEQGGPEAFSLAQGSEYEPTSHVSVRIHARGRRRKASCSVLLNRTLLILLRSFLSLWPSLRYFASLSQHFKSRPPLLRSCFPLPYYYSIPFFPLFPSFSSFLLYHFLISFILLLILLLFFFFLLSSFSFLPPTHFLRNPLSSFHLYSSHPVNISHCALSFSLSLFFCFAPFLFSRVAFLFHIFTSFSIPQLRKNKKRNSVAPLYLPSHFISLTETADPRKKKENKEGKRE